jgi:hypothetical protein
MHSKYGNSLYFILLYHFGKSVFYFLGTAAFGVVAWLLFIEREYLTQSVYEQLVILVSFLYIFFSKKEKQYALVPYITKLTVFKIRNYVLVRELLSGFNFLLFLLVVPVLFLPGAIESSIRASVCLFLGLWLMGLCLNLLTRIIRYFCIKYRLFLVSTLSIALTYGAILVLFYRTETVFSYSIFFDNIFYIAALLVGIALLIPGYFYVIKQELYQVYDGDTIGRKTARSFNPKLITSNIFSKILLLKYLRCKIFRKFLTQMLSYTTAGIVFFTMLDQRIVGLGIFLCVYTFSLLPFTLYLSSNYFDGLSTKPVSIKSLLLSSFYIHIIATTALFLILLIFIAIFDKQLILPLISLYCYTSGPVALLLLQNSLFAQKFDLFPVQSDYTIQRTFAQKVINIISGASLFGCAAIIHFFSATGCYIILTISLVIVMTYSYWIDILYKRFIQRKYRIMENLRNS